MNKNKILLLLLLAPLSFSLQAQVQRQVKNDPKLTAACVTKNKAVRAELQALIAKGKAERSIGTTEGWSLDASEKLIDYTQKQLDAGGLTTQECETIGVNLDQERAEIKKAMASGPRPAPKQAPPLSAETKACLASTLKLHLDVAAAFGKAEHMGRISEDEKRAFKKRETAFRDLRSRFMVGGLTADECKKLANTIESERKFVDQIAKSAVPPPANPASADCRFANARGYRAMRETYEALMLSPIVSEADKKSVTAKFDAVKPGPESQTPADCKKIAADIAAVGNVINAIKR